MTTFTMTINGRAVAGARSFGVIDPASGAVFADAPECDKDQLDEAMAGAHEGYLGWRDDVDARRKVMHACADAIEAGAEDLARVATLEQGMPLANARRSVTRAAESFRRYAALDLPRTVVQDDDQAFVEVVRRPLGVIAAIKPWNVPISMAVNTIAPAFLAGCSVVLKPSPYTPLATLRIGELLREVTPAGTLNVVSGGNDLGQWMAEHPIPRGVSFTGSVATGKRVNVTAAADLKRVLLELGGNDAAVVLDDMDPVEVADRVYWRAFLNSGQICMAVKRLYVPEQMYQAVVDALAAKARTTRVGPGLDLDTEMGPINNRPQYERVAGLVDDAVRAGARVAAGGRAREGAGYFYEPTILAGVADTMPIVAEEQFGPALPVLSYGSLEEAIRRANDTMFGLGASVWSADAERAAAVAERMEAGTVWINTHGVLGHEQPFAGTKWSGLGAENGPWSVHAFTEPQTIYRPGARPPA
jgi:acyl-CoA reductase-like NAD-dependent aldehyde dehydrogenase